METDHHRGGAQRHEDLPALVVVRHDKVAATGQGDVRAVRGTGIQVQPDELGNVVGGWSTGDLGGGAFLDDLAVFEDQETVGQHEGLQRVVGDEQAWSGEVRKVTPELGLNVQAGPGVKRGKWLVEQQQCRVAGERARERDALCLSAGQVGGTSTGELGQPQPGQPMVSGSAGCGPAVSTRPGGEGHVVHHTEVWKSR